jgi:hypothetical protein
VRPCGVGEDADNAFRGARGTLGLWAGMPAQRAARGRGRLPITPR